MLTYPRKYQSFYMLLPLSQKLGDLRKIIQSEVGLVHVEDVLLKTDRRLLEDDSRLIGDLKLSTSSPVVISMPLGREVEMVVKEDATSKSAEWEAMCATAMGPPPPAEEAKKDGSSCVLQNHDVSHGLQIFFRLAVRAIRDSIMERWLADVKAKENASALLELLDQEGDTPTKAQAPAGSGKAKRKRKKRKKKKSAASPVSSVNPPSEKPVPPVLPSADVWNPEESSESFSSFSSRLLSVMELEDVGDVQRPKSVTADQQPAISAAILPVRSISEPTASPVVKFCPGCGAKWIAGAKFCVECGMKNPLLANQPDPPPISVPAPPQPPEPVSTAQSHLHGVLTEAAQLLQEGEEDGGVEEGGGGRLPVFEILQHGEQTFF